VRIVPSWDLPSMRNTWQNRSEQDGKELLTVSPDQTGRPQILETILTPGEMLFVPVGYWYRIEAMEISASVKLTNFVFNNQFSVPELVNGVL